MVSKRPHDEFPESPLTKVWFQSLVDSFALKATSGTLVAVIHYHLTYK